MTFAVTVPNDFSSVAGASADSYQFPCSFRWWRVDGSNNKIAMLPIFAYSGWQSDCVVGHNRAGDGPTAQLATVAEPLSCDDIDYNNPPSYPVECQPKYALTSWTTPEEPGGYRIWPEGVYQAAFYIGLDRDPLSTDVPVASRNFVVTRTPRPNPWPLQLGDRPIDGYRPPAGYTNPGNYSPWRDPSFTCAVDISEGSCARTTYDVRLLPYAPTPDCVAAGLCSEVFYPDGGFRWTAPLPWGSGQSSYELRPLWGDYEPYIDPPHRTAPYPDQHPGWDYVYPHCPRLDWCYTEPGGPRANRPDPDPLHGRSVVDDSQYGSYSINYKPGPPTQHGGDPCAADPQNCVSSFCPEPPDECTTCGDCEYVHCNDEPRTCQWVASCGSCKQWVWRTLGHVGSARNPLQYGHGFNLRDDDRVFSPSLSNYSQPARRFWDIAIPHIWGPTGDGETDDHGQLAPRRSAGDAHLFADLQYGSASRCADIRGVISDPLIVSDNDVWGADLIAYRNNSPYSWLRALPAVLANRLPILQRAAIPVEPTPASIDAAFTYQQLAGSCELKLRSIVEDALITDRTTPLDFNAVVALFQQALADADCDSSRLLPSVSGLETSVVPWQPNLVDSPGCSFTVDGLDVDIDSGFYPHSAVLNNLVPAVQALPGYLAPDYDDDGTVTAAETLRHRNEIADRYPAGLMAMSFDPQFWYSSLVPSGGSYDLDCSSTNFAAGSCTPQVNAPLDSVAMQRVLGARDAAGLLPTIAPNTYLTDPALFRVPPLPSDGAVCWLYNPGFRRWSSINRESSQLDDHLAVVLPPYSTATDPLAVTEAPIVAGADVQYEETWGFVDSRPAPVVLIPVPNGTIHRDPDTPAAADAYVAMLRSTIEQQYDYAVPEQPYNGPFPLCGDPIRVGPMGDFFYGGQLNIDVTMCWMHLSGAVIHQSDIGDLFETVTTSQPGAPTAVPSPLRFPIRRLYSLGHTDAMSLPEFGPDPPLSQLAHASEDVPARADRFEFAQCPFFDHRGMLRTSLMLQEYNGALDGWGVSRALHRRHLIDVTNPLGGFVYEPNSHLLFYGRHERGRFDHDHALVFNHAPSIDSHLLRFDRPVYGPNLRTDGLPPKPTVMNWVGYNLDDRGNLVYTSSAGVEHYIDRALYPACPSPCPYLSYDSEPGPSELVYGLCPSTEEFGVPAEARSSSQLCTFYSNYPVSGANDGWPARAQGNLLYRTDQPLNPLFDTSACAFSAMTGKITCGSAGSIFKEDERLEFQDPPFPYCPQVAPNTPGNIQSFTLPDWSPPAWTGRFVNPGSLPADLSDTFGDPLQRGPAFPGTVGPPAGTGQSCTSSVTAPNGCGRYPCDWTFTADHDGFADWLLENPAGTAAEYIEFQWNDHYVDMGPLLCDFGVEGEVTPRGEHFEPGRFKLPSVIEQSVGGSVVFDVGHDDVVVFRRDVAGGPILREPGEVRFFAADGVTPLNAVYDTARRVHTVQMNGQLAIIRVYSAGMGSFNDYHVSVLSVPP